MMAEPLSKEREAEIRADLQLSKKLLLPTQFEEGFERDVEDLLAEVDRLRAIQQEHWALEREWKLAHDENERLRTALQAQMRDCVNGGPDNCYACQISREALENLESQK